LELLSYGDREGQKVIDVVLQHVPNDGYVDAGVAVNENVAEADRGAKSTRESLVEVTMSPEDFEELLVGARFTQSSDTMCEATSSAV
jgi:hypothetical protein